MTDEKEIQHPTPELEQVVAALDRDARLYAGLSLRNMLADEPELAHALARGDAHLTVQVTLVPAVSEDRVRILLDWPAAEIDRREIVAFVPPPVYRA